MAKGRRPLPSAVKNLRGNPGKRTPNANEPELQSGDPVMPPRLSEAAQDEWKRIVPILRTMGLLTPADGAALAAYCYAFDLWMLANDEVKEFGILIKAPVMGRKGTPEENEVVAYITRKNPAVAIGNEQLKTMKSFLVEYGLTPSSRSKLHVEKPKVVDPADAYFEKKLNAKHVN
jgi:P27 family predicted phage terminase small subunit